MSAEAPLPLVARARLHAGRTAIEAGDVAHSYADLDRASAAVAHQLLRGAADLGEARVAYLVSPGFAHVAVQWGIWRAGGVAVPLALSHPVPELEYAVGDADADTIVVSSGLADRVRGIAAQRSGRVLVAEAIVGGQRERGQMPAVASTRRAMILYTSGTTSRPKGVVSTHANLQAQVETLVGAWGWSSTDRTLLVLPLHHVHGIVNVLTCCLWAGGTCRIHPAFDARAVWRELGSGWVTVFMAVPTVYSKLITSWEAEDEVGRRELAKGARSSRLMVSGSAALPVPLLERWRAITGHVLLERYGMTEIGMAISNPLEGERRPGHVGVPLPGVQVRLVDEGGDPVQEGDPGEIEVRGASVFQEYWRRPEETAEAFREGWFRTGDVAVVEDGYYRILGRSSVDILKTGGYKVSALEIEEVLLSHPGVAECAVVGVEDEEWGERVVAAVVPKDEGSLEVGEVRRWAAERLAPYKVPREIRTVVALPRNAMGKVTKPEVKGLWARTEAH